MAHQPIHLSRKFFLLNHSNLAGIVALYSTWIVHRLNKHLWKVVYDIFFISVITVHNRFNISSISRDSDQLFCFNCLSNVRHSIVDKLWSANSQRSSKHKVLRVLDILLYQITIHLRCIVYLNIPVKISTCFSCFAQLSS